MARNNHAQDDIMSEWKRIGAALSVLLTLSAIVGSVLLVKFRVDVLEGQVGDLKTEFRAMQKILVDLDKTMTVGFSRLEARIDPMVSTVSEARSIALRAESRVIDSKVVDDFQNAPQPQPQPMRGKP